MTIEVKNLVSKFNKVLAQYATENELACELVATPVAVEFLYCVRVSVESDNNPIANYLVPIGASRKDIKELLGGGVYQSQVPLCKLV